MLSSIGVGVGWVGVLKTTRPRRRDGPRGRKDPKKGIFETKIGAETQRKQCRGQRSRRKGGRLSREGRHREFNIREREHGGRRSTKSSGGGVLFFGTKMDSERVREYRGKTVRESWERCSAGRRVEIETKERM